MTALARINSKISANRDTRTRGGRTGGCIRLLVAGKINVGHVSDQLAKVIFDFSRVSLRTLGRQSAALRLSDSCNTAGFRLFAGDRSSIRIRGRRDEDNTVSQVGLEVRGRE